MLANLDKMRFRNGFPERTPSVAVRCNIRKTGMERRIRSSGREERNVGELMNRRWNRPRAEGQAGLQLPIAGSAILTVGLPRSHRRLYELSDPEEPVAKASRQVGLHDESPRLVLHGRGVAQKRRRRSFWPAHDGSRCGYRPLSSLPDHSASARAPREMGWWLDLRMRLTRCLRTCPRGRSRLVKSIHWRPTPLMRTGAMTSLHLFIAPTA